MSTILITGGTGLIGTALTKKLVERGYDVIILTRKMRDARYVIRDAGFGLRGDVSFAEWNAVKQTIDEDAIQKADYIVHLAGANVAEGRWTKKRKKEIIDSRVKSGELLVKALKEIPNNVRAVISSSAIGWYGPDLTHPKSLRTNPSPIPHVGERGEHQRGFIETDPPSKDFLGSTCEKWEAAIQPVKDAGRRLVIFRTGLVLSNDGGAYKELIQPLKFGLATFLGNGKQVMSWIHIDDVVSLYITAIENEQWHGVYNVVAPHPVTNKDLILQIAKQRNKFYIPVRVPAFVLKAILGGMSIEVLKSATVSSEKIGKAGYQFLFPTIETAVQNLRAST